GWGGGGDGGGGGEGGVGGEGDQLFCEHLELIWPVGCKPDVDPDVAALGPSELLQSLPERSKLGLCFRIVLGVVHQHADASHAVGLLRLGGERRGEETRANSGHR